MMYILILQGEVAPLWGASCEGRLEVVEFLLDRGADINQAANVRAYTIFILLSSCTQCTCVGRAITFRFIMLLLLWLSIQLNPHRD